MRAAEWNILGALYSPQGAHLGGHNHEAVSIQRCQEISVNAADITAPLLSAHREALHHAACTAKQVELCIKYAGKQHESLGWSVKSKCVRSPDLVGFTARSWA